jgi:integrase
MPRLVHRLPQIRCHTPSGRARLRINGRHYWLGTYGSPESLREYDRLVGLYLANGRQLPSVSSHVQQPVSEPVKQAPVRVRQPVTPLPVKTVTVTTLIAEFTKWADGHYRRPDGTPTREAENFKHTTKPLRKMWGRLPVTDFGPARLIALRETWIKRDLARPTINAMTRRVRQVFRWGVSRELVPVDVYARLTALEPLQPGRGGRETSGTRGSVSWEVVEKTLPHLPPLIQAFVTVLYFVGCRVGELRGLTTGMIDRSQEIWVADLHQHKNSCRGKSRRLFIGPKAQAALKPLLLDEQPDEPIFSPLRVDDRQPKRKGKRLPGKSYARYSMAQVLRRAIDRGGIEPKWTMAMLRHSAACKILESFDIETTRQVLGHATVKMSSHYAQDSDSAAREAAKMIG